PTFNAAPVPIPERADRVRRGASFSRQFYEGGRWHYYVLFDWGRVFVYRWIRGTPMQALQVYDNVSTHFPTCLFFDAPVRVQGIVQGRVTIGSSELIEIEGDIRYIDADPLTGVTPPTSQNMLALVSEGDIKVRNTPANGRWNSGGLGLNQTNRDSTDVVITAALYALGGSFTFENQNDPDSGYVCDCSPDKRGTIYIFGAVAQRQRGYYHRANNGGTGYLRKLKYDQRFRNDPPPCTARDGWWDAESTDSLDFGDVVVGTTASDTAHLYTLYYSHLGAVYANQPFSAQRVPPFQGDSFIVPTRFTPPGVGLFTGILYVSASHEHFEIALRGRGVPPGSPAPMTVNVSPNPFNLTTTIRYTLPAPEAVRITLYDILGREAKRLELGSQVAGEHSVSLNADDLASGVYFLHLQAGSEAMIHKILLVK
ncbi:T9SS type A sorting domain-containing protein, partial [bacterium]|nr:T9SS type A sorting domain-containing protein [bacterium]